jgi:hypothetical protein
MKKIIAIIMIFAAIAVIGLLLSQNAISLVDKFVAFIATIAIGAGIVSIAQISAKNNM